MASTRDELTMQAECFMAVFRRRRVAQAAEKRRRRKPWGHGVKGQDVARALAQAQRARALAGIAHTPWQWV